MYELLFILCRLCTGILRYVEAESIKKGFTMTLLSVSQQLTPIVFRAMYSILCLKESNHHLGRHGVTVRFYRLSRNPLTTVGNVSQIPVPSSHFGVVDVAVAVTTRAWIRAGRLLLIVAVLVVGGSSGTTRNL